MQISFLKTVFNFSISLDGFLVYVANINIIFFNIVWGNSLSPLLLGQPQRRWQNLDFFSFSIIPTTQLQLHNYSNYTTFYLYEMLLSYM